MKKLMFLLVLVAIGFMFSGCSDMNQDIMSSNTDKVPVPFKGNWEGMAYVTGLYTRYITCQGNSTHLGLFNAEVNYVITYNDPQHPEYGGAIVSGSAEMIAANGDKVYLGNLTGTWGFVSNVNPMISFTINGDVAGGTGRFEDATGSLEGSGTQNYYPDPYAAQELWFSWTGSITY